MTALDRDIYETIAVWRRNGLVAKQALFLLTGRDRGWADWYGVVQVMRRHAWQFVIGQ